MIPFAFPFSDKREEADEPVVQQPTPSTVPPNSHLFPRLRPRRPPKWDSYRPHEDTRGWSSSSQYMDVAVRRLEDTTKPKTTKMTTLRPNCLSTTHST